MKILVTGGCGYIGSHVVYLLSKTGHEVHVIDNLSTGFRDALLNNETLHEIDLIDGDAVKNVIKKNGPFSAVLHFAASIVVPDSVKDPILYYRNNTSATIELLDAIKENKIPHVIFSSTAAVYGETNEVVTESSDAKPENPYGRSKLFDESILRDCAAAYDFTYAVLRYFNVAGADPEEKRLGQRFPNATHLIKVACEAACGKREKIAIFGTDYPTEDGTCIRDYVHVRDLAAAHIKALNYLLTGKNSLLANISYGTGYSVKKVLEMTQTITKKKMTIEMAGRRPGDVAKLISNPENAKNLLNWTPEYDSLSEIISTAYEFEKSLRGNEAQTPC